MAQPPRLAAPRRRTLGTALAAVLLAAAAAGCSSHSSGGQDPTGDAAKDTTVRDLGAVPIPAPPGPNATPVADAHHLQLLAMGDAVRVTVPGARALLRASGPTEDLPATSPGPPPDRTTGTLTVTVTQTTGALSLRAADFSSRDEQGKAVTLTPAGAATVTATAGHPATLTLKGTFRAGSAQLTWRAAGRPLAIWDFTIELD